MIKKAPSPAAIKPGRVFFAAFGWVNDEGVVETGIEEWQVRSIRRPRGSLSRYGVPARPTGPISKQVYVVRKTPWTWIKRSTRRGDFGWAPSITRDDRRQFTLGGPLPYGLFSTPLQAVRHELQGMERLLQRNDLDDDERTEHERVTRALRARISRLRSRK